MDCEEFISGYSDFIDRRFERHPLGDYCAHILSCCSCAEYDRVMRRGLHLVRQLDPPEPRSDFGARVRRLLISRVQDVGPQVRRWTPAAVGAAAAVLVLVVAAVFYQREATPVELPPVVVEAGTQQPTRSSLFGPAPRFTPAANLLPTPALSDDPLFVFPSQPLSLFRTPISSIGAAPMRRESARTAAQ